MNLIRFIKVTWLSPEKVLKLSFGKITNHNMVDTRTFKPKMGGLLDPRIFGPSVSFECYCGKYKGKRNEGQKCERCETLIANKNIQRWRMGHIELNTPIVNSLLFKNLSSVISKLIGINAKKLEDIVYLRSYVIIDNGKSVLVEPKQVLEKEIDPLLIKKLLEEIIVVNRNTDVKNAKTVISQAQKLIDELPEIDTIPHYYSVLNISKSASEEEIKKAYKKLSSHNSESEENEKNLQFQQVNAAYAVLSDPKKRELYDLVDEKRWALLTKNLDFLDWNTKKVERLIEKEQQKKEIELDDEDLVRNSSSKMLFWDDHLKFLKKWGVVIKTGSEAFLELIKNIDPKKELEKTRYTKNKSDQIKTKFYHYLLKSGLKLEWIVFRNLPVLPAGLRPVVRLKKGEASEKETIANTQINNLIRKVILANDNVGYYLKSSEGLFFGEMVINNAKRRLQNAVDQLLQGTTSKQGEVKGLAQSLSGKDGLLRLYSLGKRTNFSGRAVISPSPHISLDQIDLPLEMAVVIFRPLIIRSMLQQKYAFTVREAQELIDRGITAITKEDQQFSHLIIDELNKICSEHPILFNRPPSLHRLSIQAAYARLTLGRTIGLPALVTTPLNADFDGDNLIIKALLLKEEAQELKELLLTSNHIIDPKNAHLITVPKQDMMLGIYHLTKETKKKQPKFFTEINAVWKEYELKKISLHDVFILPAYLLERDLVEINSLVFTTLGKIIINKILPAGIPYIGDIDKYLEGCQMKKFGIEESEREWNQYLPGSGWNKKNVLIFLDKLSRFVPLEIMCQFLDKFKNIGFDYANQSGISISPFELGELISKEQKQAQVTETEKRIAQIEEYYNLGLYSEQEKKERQYYAWQECKDQLTKMLFTALEEKKDTAFYQIWESGARISAENLVQMFAMRGHVTNYLGDIMETPIVSCLWEGLTPFECLTLNYGMRKGMIDLSLKTAEAGYLTRRLVEATEEVIVEDVDCGTELDILAQNKDPELLAFEIYGRVLSRDIRNKEQQIIVPSGSLLGETETKAIRQHEINSVHVFSPLTCELASGICQKCYGGDLSKIKTLIAIGSAVGIIAAQSVGEPNTQLTMRTFHTGGISGEGGDIVLGLPKIKILLDNITPNKLNKAVIAKYAGTITVVEDKVIKQEREDNKEVIYPYLKETKRPLVTEGQKVEKGTKLTSGVIELDEYLDIAGVEICQEYIKSEIQKVYAEQGIEIHNKHIEIIVRQMTSRVKIIDRGDSELFDNDVVRYQMVKEENKRLIRENKRQIIFKWIISSLKDLASSSSSALASASFQSTVKTLVNYSLYQPVDYLTNPKANLITGQMPPIGKGFLEKQKYLWRHTPQEEIDPYL